VSVYLWCDMRHADQSMPSQTLKHRPTGWRWSDTHNAQFLLSGGTLPLRWKQRKGVTEITRQRRYVDTTHEWTGAEQTEVKSLSGTLSTSKRTRVHICPIGPGKWIAFTLIRTKLFKRTWFWKCNPVRCEFPSTSSEARFLSRTCCQVDPYRTKFLSSKWNDNLFWEYIQNGRAEYSSREGQDNTKKLHMP
jgi:hypothetical protein